MRIEYHQWIVISEPPQLPIRLSAISPTKLRPNIAILKHVGDLNAKHGREEKNQPMQDLQGDARLYLREY